jgi:hypothetical protein
LSRIFAPTIIILIGFAFQHAIGSMRPMLPRHEVDSVAAKTDSIPPPPPSLKVIGVYRGVGPRDNGDGTETIWSSDGIGSVSLEILSIEDNMSSPLEMGFRLVCIGAVSKIAHQLNPNYDFRPHLSNESTNKYISLSWNDGGRHTQEAILVRFAVYSIDHAGNVSAEADTIVISDPGRP